MNQDDLSKQLNSFSISSSEEKITEALNKTHIASTPTVPSIFSLPSQPTQPSPSQQPSFYSGDVQNKTNYLNTDTTSDWDPSSSSTSHWNHTPSQTTVTEDGWGDGPPSYTSISQGTYFGFNSILEAPNAILAHSTHANASTNTTAFSRYRGMPVTFASAAAEAAAGATKNSDIPK
ncbi:uncharacterized protein ATC70_012642 [Mucor velutinosus]|uniref:Uncharacterized protein n=1 Tax=Mucor velutinosus TaxID=708070 RepID=A0AAN7D5X6_9FUNG|nr:hypothetical protein ATC70_012642 [Mucor velutinosus]